MATADQRLARAEAMVRQLQGGLGFYARLENDVVNAYPNNVTSKVPLDTIMHDPLGLVDLANDWVVIPRAGWWVFEGGGLQTAAMTAGSITYQTSLGGASGGSCLFDTYFPPVVARKVLRGVGLMRCEEGDHVFVQFFHNSGASLTADGVAADFNFFRGAWLCPS